MSPNDNLYKAITKAICQCCNIVRVIPLLHENVNLIKMKSFDLLLNFLWFISSKLINVQQTHVKYINPAWINVEVKVIDIFYYYLLIFLGVLFETISH